MVYRGLLRAFWHDAALIILIAPAWPREFWYSALINIDILLVLSDMLMQSKGQILYLDPTLLHLTA